MKGQQLSRYADRSGDVKQFDPLELGKETFDYYSYFKKRLEPRHRAAKQMWLLYLNQLKDNRAAKEKWRSMVHSSHHSSAIETAIAGAINMIYPAGRSPIMPEAVPGLGQQELADKMQRWFDYVIRMNRSKRETELELREIIVQSLCIRKNIFIERVRIGSHIASDEEFAEFDMAIESAIGKLGQPPPMPEQFSSTEEFEDALNEFRKVAFAAGVEIPTLPRSGPLEMVHYRGPHKKRVSYFNFFYDLAMPLQEQEIVVEKHYVPKQWVLDRTGDGDEYPFDPRMVEEYMMTASGRASEEELELQNIFGGSDESASSPAFRDMVICLEAYHVGSKHPYRFCLGEQNTAAINKNCFNPFEHGEHPYTLMGGLELPFASSSMSELYQIEPIIKEGNTLRGLRLDGTKFAVLPIFSRLKSSGLSELANQIFPGMIHDSPMGAKGMQQVSLVQVPEAAFREGREIMGEIDTWFGTPPQVRGEVAPPRTTAQGIERAQSNVTIRAEMRVTRWEEDNETTIRQWLALAHQHYKDKELKELGGGITSNPLIEFDRKDFIQAINMKYAFRAATTAINKAILNQALQNVFTLGANAQVPRFRPDKLFERIVRNIDEVTADEAFYSEQEWEQVQAQQAQAQEAQAPTQGPPQGGSQGAPPAPPQQ